MTNCYKTNYIDTVSQSIEFFLSKDSLSYKYVVLIPNSGCSGCISNAENFYLENVNNSDIKFIFTYIASKKNLYLKLNREFLSKNNVYIDLKNDFHFKNFKESIYPIVFFIENGQVVSTASVDNLAAKISNY